MLSIVKKQLVQIALALLPKYFGFHMNILHFLSAPTSGGAEIYVKDLAKYLAKKEHNLHIVFLSSAKDDGRSTEFEREFLNDLRSSNVSIYIVGNETRKKPWLGMLRIRKYVKDNNIDVYHTHLAYGIVFSTLLKIPVIYTHHNITRRWGDMTYKLFNILVDEYVGISEICANALKEYTGRKVTTIYNAVSLDKFTGYSRVRVLGQDSIINIAMIGTLQPQKDYLNMLHALTLLDENIKSQISVSIAGEGPKIYRVELQDFVKKNNLQDFVRFVGVTSNVPKFLYYADLFVMSSAWEGSPIALTEAAISGLPCIVTNVGGCSEIIERSSNGTVIEPNDSQAIAHEITNFVLNKSLIEKFSQNAIDRTEQYSIKKAANSHVSLYNLSIAKQ